MAFIHEKSRKSHKNRLFLDFHDWKPFFSTLPDFLFYRVWCVCIILIFCNTVRGACICPVRVFLTSLATPICGWQLHLPEHLFSMVVSSAMSTVGCSECVHLGKRVLLILCSRKTNTPFEGIPKYACLWWHWIGVEMFDQESAWACSSWKKFFVHAKVFPFEDGWCCAHYEPYWTRTCATCS